MSRKCLSCASKNVIPDLPFRDHYGDAGFMSKDVSVAVQGDPNAYIFTETLRSPVTANVCGDCGHITLRAVHHRQLLETWNKSRGA